ncbi:MAG: molybdopterin-binding protein [Defluviicoccus sp.]|nr:molybdopterin-binding protein [Defluviicoccus sp.]
MAEQGIVTACVVVIGNEILSGRTQDRNVNYLARGLEALGIRLREVRMIPDDRETIVGTVNACRAAFDYVITTGGIGPTHDDITSECVAEAFGVGLYRDPEVVELIRSYLRSGEMNEARMRMATFPEGAELIANPVSAAPGYRIDNVFVLAGVPQIMQAMFDGMEHHLSGGARMRARAVHVHLPEGAIAEALGRVQERHPAIDIGSYPAMRGRRFGVSVVLRGTDGAALDRALAEIREALVALGGEPTDESPDNPPEPED